MKVVLENKKLYILSLVLSSVTNIRNFSGWEHQDAEGDSQRPKRVKGWCIINELVQFLLYEM